MKCLDTYDLDPEQALRAFPRLAADVDPALGVVRAEWLLDLGRYDDARAVAEGVLERATDDLRARYVLAHCDYVRGDYAAAIERLNALVRENPNLYQPVLLLTRCLLESGDAKQAANLGMVVAKRDPSRLGLQGLALLAMHDDGRKDGWELFSTKFLQDNNLDDESMRIGLGELLRRKRPELVVDWCESHRTVWGQKAEQPLTLSLLEAEALLMLGRKADAERLCAALEPQLRLAEHRAKLAALRARAQAAADGESPQAR